MWCCSPAWDTRACSMSAGGSRGCSVQSLPFKVCFSSSALLLCVIKSDDCFPRACSPSLGVPNTLGLCLECTSCSPLGSLLQGAIGNPNHFILKKTDSLIFPALFLLIIITADVLKQALLYQAPAGVRALGRGVAADVYLGAEVSEELCRLSSVCAAALPGFALVPILSNSSLN